MLTQDKIKKLQAFYWVNDRYVGFHPYVSWKVGKKPDPIETEFRTYHWRRPSEFELHMRDRWFKATGYSKAINEISEYRKRNEQLAEELVDNQMATNIQ
jgi:hypothetical protein